MTGWLLGLCLLNYLLGVQIRPANWKPRRYDSLQSSRVYPDCRRHCCHPIATSSITLIITSSTTITNEMTWKLTCTSPSLYLTTSTRYGPTTSIRTTTTTTNESTGISSRTTTSTAILIQTIISTERTTETQKSIFFTSVNTFIPNCFCTTQPLHETLFLLIEFLNKSHLAVRVTP